MRRSIKKHWVSFMDSDYEGFDSEQELCDVLPKRIDQTWKVLTVIKRVEPKKIM